MCRVWCRKRKNGKWVSHIDYQQKGALAITEAVLRVELSEIPVGKLALKEQPVWNGFQLDFYFEFIISPSMNLFCNFMCFRNVFVCLRRQFDRKVRWHNLSDVKTSWSLFSFVLFTVASRILLIFYIFFSCKIDITDKSLLLPKQPSDSDDTKSCNFLLHWLTLNAVLNTKKIFGNLRLDFPNNKFS